MRFKNVKLPSQRELADYLDLNFTTIGQAYKHAMEKGLLYTNIGSGTFVSPNAFHSITISTNQVADHLIDLGLVSSFDMCNQRILPFIESVSKNAALNSLLNYRDPLGTHFQRATAPNGFRHKAFGPMPKKLPLYLVSRMGWP